MKKVAVFMLILFLFGCQSREQIEEEINQKVTEREKELTDSLAKVFRADVQVRELELGAEIDSIAELLNEKSPELTVYQSEIKKHKASIRELNKQLNAAGESGKASKDSLLRELSIMMTKYGDLEIEKDQYLDQIKSLESENSRLKAQLTDLKKETPDVSKEENNRYKVAGNVVSELKSEEGRGFVVYKVNPEKSNVRLFWRDNKKELYDNFLNYEKALTSQGELLLFATNGGMYQPDQSPQGLYIENGRTLQKADTKKEGYGNFYMQPNGIFLITDEGVPHVIKTQDLRGYERRGIRYATQSGPMLLTNGTMNARFMKDSPNFHIRSGVGVDSEGNLIFIISETRVRFYELAKAFEAMGCANALYLDGAISQTYLPEIDRLDAGGGFGVMIGVSRKTQ
jgi:uncharacterized protein YigE (DUF2233 family)